MQGIPQGQSSQGGSQKPSLSWQSPGPAKTAPGFGEKPKASQSAPKPAEKSGQGMSPVGTYVGIFIAGLIVGGLLGWGIVGMRSGTGSTATTTMQGSQTSTTSAMGAGDVTVASPQSAGLSVAISNVNVTVPTWIVVYDNNSGQPGLALGATLFYPASMGGETSGSVSLLRATVTGKNYLVGERIDDGDHALSFKTDMAARDASGTPILLPLTIQ